MSTHGIIMSSRSIRGILDGTKTVTRRTGGKWMRASIDDVLWVKESWCLLYNEDRVPVRPERVLYRASPELWPEGLDNVTWQTPLYMPYRHARIFMRVVYVGQIPVQALANDPEELAAEGFRDIDEFIAEWDRLNPHRSYATNPTTVRIGFERCERPNPTLVPPVPRAEEP